MVYTTSSGRAFVLSEEAAQILGVWALDPANFWSGVVTSLGNPVPFEEIQEILGAQEEDIFGLCED